MFKKLKNSPDENSIGLVFRQDAVDIQSFDLKSANNTVRAGHLANR